MARTPSPAQLVAAKPVKPAKRSPSITFRLDDEDDQRLRAMAKGAGTGPSTLVRRIVENYLRTQQTKTKKGER